MSTEERLESLEKKIQKVETQLSRIETKIDSYNLFWVKFEKDALFDQIRNLNTPYSEGDLK